MAPGTRAKIVEIAWDTDRRFERDVRVVPSKFA